MLISKTEALQLFNQPGTKIIENYPHMPKVLETANGEIIKVFFKKWPSSNSLRPYALRFCENSKRLNALGFTAPIINKVQYCAELKAHFVFYHKLPGETFFSLLKKGDTQIFEYFMECLSLLHQKGVYFRAIHLNNLLYQGNRSFALIDISDVRFRKGPLSFYLRYRNLRHLLLRVKDRDFWNSYGINQLLDLYYKITNMGPFKRKLFNLVARI